MKYKAYIFDLNGTMVDDMDYHINAWHNILKKLGANLSKEEVKKECYGKNEELLERVFPGRFPLEERTKHGMEKEKQYQQEFKPNLKLIKGLDEFLEASHKAGIKLAIGSAAIIYNVDFVLDGCHVRKYFDAIVSADDVAKSKPDPETFLKCAEMLHLDVKDCLVFEDSSKGVEASYNARMDCIVLTTMHTQDEFKSCSNVVKFIKDYSSLTI